jgi:hypothetical protein
VELYLYPQYVFMAWCLVKHRDNFTLPLSYFIEYKGKTLLTLYGNSRDSSVGIALGYGMDDRGSRVRLPAGAENFFLHHRCVQDGSGAHLASYPMGTMGSFPGGKAAGA